MFTGYWLTGSNDLGIEEIRTRVAVKSLKENDRTKHEDFVREATVMRALRHPNIVTMYGVVSTSFPMMIVLEFMTNGSLVKYLRHARAENEINPKTDQKLLIHVTYQIASACAYIESKNFIHRDIRCANVLVGTSLLHCKLADFGLARAVQNSSFDGLGSYEPIGKVKFPVRWTAPEAAKHKIFTIKSDVWGFGVLLYEVAKCGEIPYAGMENREVLEFLEDGKRLDVDDELSEFPLEYRNVIKACWRHESLDRPTFESIQQSLE